MTLVVAWLAGLLSLCVGTAATIILGNAIVAERCGRAATAVGLVGAVIVGFGISVVLVGAIL